MKEISQLQQKILTESGAVKFFTQQEFNEALTMAQVEIMHVAIETTKQAILIEREACAQIVLDQAIVEDEGEICTALRDVAELIRNRIPSQRQ